MRFAPGAITLSDVIGGTLAAGIIPAPRFRRLEQRVRNAVQVVVAAASTLIISNDVGNVVAGDRILVTSIFSGTKGATAGDVDIFVLKEAGTATIEFPSIGNVLQDFTETLAALGQRKAGMSGILRVITSGTCTIGMRGLSPGSNFTIDTDRAGLDAWIIPGS